MCSMCQTVYMHLNVLISVLVVGTLRISYETLNKLFFLHSSCSGYLKEKNIRKTLVKRQLLKLILVQKGQLQNTCERFLSLVPQDAQ